VEGEIGSELMGAKRVRRAAERVALAYGMNIISRFAGSSPQHFPNSHLLLGLAEGREELVTVHVKVGR
jgi:hypothetical protein